jgi:hypothetical protein
MSLVNVIECLELVIRVSIFGIKAVMFWYTLREVDFDATLLEAGKPLMEHYG